MKGKLLSTGLFLAFFCLSGFSQELTAVKRTLTVLKTTPTLELTPPNMEPVRAEDETNDRNGMLYRIGVYGYTDITTENQGTWVTTADGSKVWQLNVKFSGAEALSFLFETFKIYGGTTVDVFAADGKRLHKTLTSADVLDHFQQNIALCFGDEMTLQIHEPAGTQASEIKIDRVVYNYRSTGNPNVQKINESESCEVNVNCTPVGDSWQEEKRGVARIYVVDGSGAGWCTGSLMNNTALNCKPLFLTALHCGVSTSASNSNQWRFYFRYESPNCTNPSSAGTLDDYYITGCVRLANSNDGGGDSGSDFLLVQLGTLANESTTVTTLKTANFNAYWNGWDANTTATTGGAGIHHPAGDIKKISTFTGSTTSSGWNGNGLQSHWRLTWTSNANGYGVTEGGSSGSPLFNNAGRQVGTLTGGGSYCTAQTAQDYYGKMSYHWTSNGTPANEQLKTYLDPGNTGLLVLDGSANPCAVVSSPPVADFSANQTTVSTGATVQFSDLSTNSPTSWTWSITPGTGWSYAGGTTAASQNPQVTFTTNGQYTVALTATNSFGSDTETKTNYITVTTATAPCTASSDDCDEFIKTITLATINNTTACTNYTLYPGATLTNGQQYTLTFIPQIGTTAGNYYIDDQFAAWIDYNHDLDFDDAGEQVALSTATASGFTNSFTFTVPANASVGQVVMRCRLHYSGTDVGEGTVTPCGTATYGEVEDYTLTLAAPSTSNISLTCGGMQTVTASTGGTTVPNVVSAATVSTTCGSGGLQVSQNPTVGTALNNGANVITITAIDNCGNSQTCTTTINYINDLGVDELGIFGAVAVYPNPVLSTLSIDLTSVAAGNVQVELLDITGKLLAVQTNVQGSVAQFDISNFAKGMYQVRMTSGQSMKTTRVVKL
jgi:PKD repeat protein